MHAINVLVHAFAFFTLIAFVIIFALMGLEVLGMLGVALAGCVWRGIDWARSKRLEARRG